MSAEGPTEKKESKFEEKRRLVTEEQSILAEALAKVEEKFGAVTWKNVFKKTDGILTWDEAHDLSDILQDREGGIIDVAETVEVIMKGLQSDDISDSDLELERQYVVRAHALLAKLSA